MLADRLVWLLVGLGASTALAGCLDRRDSDVANAQPNPCTPCHGSADRAGSPLSQAAPPNDLGGNTDVSAPGVGAHQIHLVATDKHRGIECGECHVVPRTVEEPGHLDTPGRARFAPGPMATFGGRTPSYDAATHTCSNVYCHLDAKPTWTAPRADACGSCHGVPPAAPHPQSKECYACHGETVDKSGNVIDLQKHIDGKVQVSQTCHSCHGTEESPAPPRDLEGNTDASKPGVGAHQKHLAGGAKSRPVECAECHVVPTNVTDPGHLDDSKGAEVVFAGIAKTDKRNPTFDPATLRCSDSWCHAPQPDKKPAASPRWTGEDGDATCTTCHGKPPPAPHVQMSNCSFCHGDVAGDKEDTIKNRALHVDGKVEVVLPKDCNACHGSADSNAPPRDIAGETSTTARGVGAHRKHLADSLFYRKVECNECHVVPATVEAPGHFDTPLPAELTFSGVATAGAASPAWDGVKCANTYCHATTVRANEDLKGALTAPQWTKVDGTQVYCGSCHGIPPIEPDPNKPQTKHPIAYECPDCHKNLSSGFIFKDPSLHVNGKVDMTVGVDL
jgi:predicted CxxxxCH...CXXCH cytochrome family protein